MNIHKSKGLEFGIVYFSGLYKEFNRKDIKNKLKVSEDYGLILPPADNDDVNLLYELALTFYVIFHMLTILLQIFFFVKHF